MDKASRRDDPRSEDRPPLLTDESLSKLSIQEQNDQLRQYLAALESENRQQADAIQKIQQELDQQRLIKHSFLADLGHEMRTPLGAMVGFAEMLADRSLSSTQRNLVGDSLRRNGQHLLSLLDDILDLSKIEKSRLQIEQSVASPCHIVREVVAKNTVFAQEKGLSIKLVPNGEIPRSVKTDPKRVRQILFNLLSNAVKFTESGHITVQLYVDVTGKSPQWKCTVEDTGIGVAEENVERIFEPFYRSNSTSKRFEGTGLGLTISKAIAEVLGGDLSVTSVPEKGTKFCLSLPLTPKEASDLIEWETLIAPPNFSPDTSTPIRFRGAVLLAEDNLDNQQVLTYYLEAAGIHVTVVSNGILAVDLASAGEFDLVLMDMAMPEMDGYEATFTLRQLHYKKPIIALTAYSMRGDREQCLSAGCTDYLAKPVTPASLYNCLGRYLAKSEAPIAADNPREERLERLIAKYQASLPEKIQELRQHLSNANLQGLAETAHKVKGSAGMYGFLELSETARLLETAAREGQDLELLTELLGELATQAASGSLAEPARLWD